MVIDRHNILQRNVDVLLDICHHRLQLANELISICNSQGEDLAYYQSEIRRHKCYDV